MSRQLLLVRSRGSDYALDASHVREITSRLPATRLPGAGPEVIGLVNVRGQLLPVIDLARCLGGSAVSDGEGELVIVTFEGRTFGLLVDEVRDTIQSADEPSGSELLRGQGPGGLIREVGHFGEAVVLEVDVRELAAQSLA